MILGYVEEGQDLVVVAMNGGGEGHPAWWTNLRHDPRATVALAGGERRRVRARRAAGAERERLWARWRDVDASIDAHAAARSTPTPVVVLAPDPDA